MPVGGGFECQDAVPRSLCFRESRRAGRGRRIRGIVLADDAAAVQRRRRIDYPAVRLRHDGADVRNIQVPVAEQALDPFFQFRRGIATAIDHGLGVAVFDRVIAAQRNRQPAVTRDADVGRAETGRAGIEVGAVAGEVAAEHADLLRRLDLLVVLGLVIGRLRAERRREQDDTGRDGPLADTHGFPR